MGLIVVATTIAPYKMVGGLDQSQAWLMHVPELVADARQHGHDVQYFAAIETDGRGLLPVYAQFISSLLMTATHATEASHWEFSLTTTDTEYDTRSRLKRICTGRNLIAEHAMECDADWILHLDSDTEPEPETFSKLLALDWPIVCGDVPTYSSHGEPVNRYSFPVERYTGCTTAGYALVHRSVFKQLRWRWSLDDGMTDDPCYWADADRLGYPPLVRKDCVGTHHPGMLYPLEQRIAAHDRQIQ